MIRNKYEPSDLSLQFMQTNQYYNTNYQISNINMFQKVPIDVNHLKYPPMLRSPNNSQKNQTNRLQQTISPETVITTKVYERPKRFEPDYIKQQGVKQFSLPRRKCASNTSGKRLKFVVKKVEDQNLDLSTALKNVIHQIKVMVRQFQKVVNNMSVQLKTPKFNVLTKGLEQINKKITHIESKYIGIRQLLISQQRSIKTSASALHDTQTYNTNSLSVPQNLYNIEISMVQDNPKIRRNEMKLKLKQKVRQQQNKEMKMEMEMEMQKDDKYLDLSKSESQKDLNNLLKQCTSKRKEGKIELVNEEDGRKKSVEKDRYDRQEKQDSEIVKPLVCPPSIITQQVDNF